MWLTDYLLELLYYYVHRHLVQWIHSPKDADNIQQEAQLVDRAVASMLSSNATSPGSDPDDDTLHIQILFLDSEKKRMCCIPLEVNRSMKVGQVKQLLMSAHQETVKQASNLALIFMGRVLSDNVVLNQTDLGDQSIIHVIDNPAQPQSEEVDTLKHKLTTLEASTSTVISNYGELDHEEPFVARVSSSSSPSLEDASRLLNMQKKLYFFIYCEACATLSNGKLRMKCAECGQGSVICDDKPGDWKALLEPNSILATCYTPGCGQVYARFYFKCMNDLEHRTSTQVFPLPRIRHNTIHVPCLSCYDPSCAIVLVFPCDHVICLECFRDYCRSFLAERRFMLQPVNIDFGVARSVQEQLVYTTNCPLDCNDSWLEDDYFRLLDQHSHTLYNKFRHEEDVLRRGGFFCPHPNCGADYFAQQDANDCALVQCEACGLYFCVACIRKGQFDSIFCARESEMQQANEKMRQQAQQDLDGESTNMEQVKEKSNYLEAILTRFTNIRLGSDRKEQAKWQDSLSRNKIREIAKPCPRCGTATERNEGCMHMVCTRNRCDFNWCWICECEWNSECLAMHWFG